MFREIVLHESEGDWHRYLHRSSDGTVTDHWMKRLTFGIWSSPFLATRVIQHLAEQYPHSHPRAAQTILNEFYVDDNNRNSACYSNQQA